jgi:anti-sigma factor RsiW
VLPLLHDALDGNLPQHERQAVDAHVRECAACERAWKELSCTRGLMRRLPRAPMPDPMKQKILDTLRRKSPPKS